MGSGGEGRSSAGRGVEGPGARKFAGGGEAAEFAGVGEQQERRRGRTDRRDPSRAAAWSGLDRRAGGGCRRLPQPRWRQWPSIAAAAVLGVVAAVGLQALRAAPVVVAEVPVAVRVGEVQPIGLQEAQDLRDAACALTPAGVALDERAHATWVPRLARLEAAADDPRTRPEVREELNEALAALSRVGIRGAP